MTTDEAGWAPTAHPVIAPALVTILAERHDLHANGIRIVVAIAGESGSGKSVTALALARQLSADGVPSDVIHQDDYFHRPPATNHAHRLRNLASVGPHEVDFARLCDHVAAFRAGASTVLAPIVDYPGNRFLTVHRNFATLAVLIVEGTYVLEHVPADLRIFLAATSDDTRDRRVARNRDIDAPIVEEVLAIEHVLIAGQAQRADVIIDRDFQITRAAR